MCLELATHLLAAFSSLVCDLLMDLTAAPLMMSAMPCQVSCEREGWLIHAAAVCCLTSSRAS